MRVRFAMKQTYVGGVDRCWRSQPRRKRLCGCLPIGLPGRSSAADYVEDSHTFENKFRNFRQIDRFC